MPYHKPSLAPAPAIFGHEIILDIDVRKRPARFEKRFSLKAMKTTKDKQTTYSYKTMKSPVGRLKLVASKRGLAAILWENDDPKRVRLAPLVEDETHPVLLEAERQLNDYPRANSEIFLRLTSRGTEFQRKCGSARGHPFGDSQLWRHRKTDRASKSGACSRSDQRKKPHLHHRPMPPGNRFQWQTDRFRRRLGDQSLPVENRIRKRGYVASEATAYGHRSVVFSEISLRAASRTTRLSDVFYN
jgi:hypothetical protein